MIQKSVDTGTCHCDNDWNRLIAARLLHIDALFISPLKRIERGPPCYLEFSNAADDWEYLSAQPA